ncbi:hypothetical protein L7F22_025977 [Adiantum nelumboides]|nr:hypothetical protein [Adiantum nelumboides]
MASTASPDYSEYPSYDEYSQHQDPRPLNRLKVAVIVLFLCLTFLFLALHYYGKWQLRRSLNRRNANINALLEPTSKGGLRKDAIALLPTFIYRVTSISDEATGNSLENTGFLHCAICLTEFQHNEQGRMLPACKHSFHMDCIDMWFYSHSTCPLCRAAVTPAVAMSAGTSSHTHEQQEPGADKEAATGHEIQNSINPPSPHNSDTCPLCRAAITPAVAFNSGSGSVHWFFAQELLAQISVTVKESLF